MKCNNDVISPHRGRRGLPKPGIERELTRRVTEAIASVAGEGMRLATGLTVGDVAPTAWGVARQRGIDNELCAMAAQTR